MVISTLINEKCILLYGLEKISKRMEIAMRKTIDFNKSIFEICNENPEIVDIMKALGFDSIGNPAMLNTAGRFMTIPKGAAMKKINLDHIKEILINKGYDITE